MCHFLTKYFDYFQTEKNNLEREDHSVCGEGEKYKFEAYFARDRHNSKITNDHCAVMRRTGMNYI